MTTIMGMTVSAEMVEQWLFDYGLRLIATVLILVVGWMAAKLLRRVTANLMARAHVEQILISFISNILYALVLMFVVIAALNKLGIQTASLVAIIGAAGLAIGLALQGSLSNFAAGVMIILFRHFKIGDAIQGNNVTGTVVDMNIFTTTLHMPTNETVIIPNSLLTSNPLINITANKLRRIDIAVNIGYEDDLDKAEAVLASLIEADQRILKNPAPFVGVDGLAENGVTIAMRVWVKRDDYGDVRTRLLRNVKTGLEAEGISLQARREIHMVRS